MSQIQDKTVDLEQIQLDELICVSGGKSSGVLYSGDPLPPYNPKNPPLVVQSFRRRDINYGLKQVP